MEKLLSVIVPVYKVEAFINKCLDSLVLDDTEQMKRLEVIIVNDGTPDRSAELSREYVKRYPETFRQIDKENGGHGSAWNVGVKEATGKYVRFLDSDDWFTNLDRLLNDLADCNADIVISPLVQEFILEGRSVTYAPPPAQSRLSSIEHSIRESSDWVYTRASFWACTYKADILKPLQPLFAEKIMYDDTILYWTSLVYGRTYTTLDYPVYHYLLGRPWQTMSVAKRRIGAVSYWKSFEQYERVRSRVDGSVIPEGILQFIEMTFVSYALYIFPFMVYLPLREAKTKMGYLWDKYLRDCHFDYHIGKRYEKLPFGLFYIIELIRKKFYLKLFHNEPLI